jgi:hypothetical protein
MRITFLLAATLLLAGCNMIMTEQPMFSATDRGTPELREGVWLSDDPECPVDDSRPVDAWPTCASWMVVKNGLMTFPGESAATGLADDPMPFLITGGRPRIWQLSITEPRSGRAMTFYVGFEATEVGPDGKVIAYRTWPGLCGPPPPRQPGASEDDVSDMVTHAPFAGLIPQGDGSCKPVDTDALWAAIADSRGLDTFETGRWVRARP